MTRALRWTSIVVAALAIVVGFILLVNSRDQSQLSSKAAQGGAQGQPYRGEPVLSPADKDAVTRIWVNVGKALGAYERLLTCGPSRFDRWAHGEAAALTHAEQRGAALFVGTSKR